MSGKQPTNSVFFEYLFGVGSIADDNLLALYQPVYGQVYIRNSRNTGNLLTLGD
jgi:hypothetical protein